MNWRNYRILVVEMTVTDFRLRYTQTALSFLWALIKPFLLFAVLATALSWLAPANIDNYVSLLLIGIIAWNFFAEATLGSIYYVLGKKELITKINFPINTIPIVTTLHATFFLIVNTILLLALVPTIRQAIGWHTLLLIPALLGYIILTLGIAWIVSATCALYRDFVHIWEVGLQIGFFATPIIYPLTAVPSSLTRWLHLNPITSAIELLRHIFLNTDHVRYEASILAITGLGLGVAGFLLFSAASSRMRESL